MLCVWGKSTTSLRFNQGEVKHSISVLPDFDRGVLVKITLQEEHRDAHPVSVSRTQALDLLSASRAPRTDLPNNFVSSLLIVGVIGVC